MDESPWRFSPSLFTRRLEQAESAVALSLADPNGRCSALTPSQARALEALGDGGTLLDVGAGSGAASLALVPLATHVTAVDESAEMLEAFSENARARSIAFKTVLGTWPECASSLDLVADVVVCHNVFYNVSDLASFAKALTGAARRRVVAEITDLHPQARVNDLWMHFHSLPRPEHPSATDAVAVLKEAGIAIHEEHFIREATVIGSPDDPEALEFLRRRLCLPPNRIEELAAWVRQRETVTQEHAVTIFWDIQETLA